MYIKIFLNCFINVCDFLYIRILGGIILPATGGIIYSASIFAKQNTLED